VAKKLAEIRVICGKKNKPASIRLISKIRGQKNNSRKFVQFAAKKIRVNQFNPHNPRAKNILIKQNRFICLKSG